MKNFRLFTFLSALIWLMAGACPPLAAQSDPPGLAWKRVLGGSKADVGNAVTTTYDGRVVIAGTSHSLPARRQDGFVAVLDAAGRTVFTRVVGGPDDDGFNAVTQTVDGGFVLAGWTQARPGHGRDAWLVKLSEHGDTLWQHSFGGQGEEAFNDVVELAGGELAVTGFLTAADGSREVLIARFLADGTFLRQRTFGSRGYDEGVAIAATADGQNLAVAGVTSQGRGLRNLWLLVLDSTDTPRHYHTYGTRQWEEVRDLVCTRDGGYALVGLAKTNGQNHGNGLKDVWLFKTAANGDLIWQTMLGGRANDAGGGLAELPDGGFAVVGHTYSHQLGANTADGFVAKVDSAGRPGWQYDQPLGGKAQDELRAAALLPDGSLVAVGVTGSLAENAAGNDAWVVCFNPERRETPAPARLTVQTARLLDSDGTLEEGERAFLEIDITNQGTTDAFDVDLLTQEQGAQPTRLTSRVQQKIGLIPAGQTRRVRMPVRANAGVLFSDVELLFFCTDAGRGRSTELRFYVPVKPLSVPPNFLGLRWTNAPAPMTGDSFRLETRTGILNLAVQGRADRPLERRHFTVLLDGAPYHPGSKAGDAPLRRTAARGGATAVELSLPVMLTPGEHTLEIVLEMETRRASSGVYRITYNDRPNLHLIALGISHADLGFTVNDARELSRALTGQEGVLFDRVYATTLINGERTAAGVFQTAGARIREVFATLREQYGYTIYPRDLMLVFISSHGRMVNGAFKIVPTDYDLEGEAALVDFRKDVLAGLTGLGCHTLLLIDACQSGGTDSLALGAAQSTDETARADAVLRLAGTAADVATVASCRASESSWEDSAWQHGAFTRALLGALHNEPFTDKEGPFTVSADNAVVTLGELYAYLQRRVPAMVEGLGKNGTQHPHMDPAQLERTHTLPVFEIGPK